MRVLYHWPVLDGWRGERQRPFARTRFRAAAVYVCNPQLPWTPGVKTNHPLSTPVVTLRSQINDLRLPCLTAIPHLLRPISVSGSLRGTADKVHRATPCSRETRRFPYRGRDRYIVRVSRKSQAQSSTETWVFERRPSERNGSVQSDRHRHKCANDEEREKKIINNFISNGRRVHRLVLIPVAYIY